MSTSKELSKERMGEIALLVLTHQTAERLPSAEELKRNIPNKAKELGIDPEEARAFLDQILPDAVRIRLGCKSVALDWSA